jgi:tocopherol O-methyltransferase
LIASRTELTPEAVAGHYDELDFFYREIWGEHVHHGFWKTGRESSAEAVRQLVEIVAERAEVKSGARICDIGCGYGATARQLAREHGADVTAITISGAQFAFAKTATNGESVRYVLGDWLCNDLPPASFDAAIAIESSEHMPDQRAFFIQAHRVLRCGGRFVICAWLAREGSSRIENRFLLEPICREGRMPRMGTELDYKRFFEEAGFHCERFEDITSKVKKTWPICAGRFLAALFRQPRYAKFLFSRHAQNRVFALTIFRIWLAYNVGSMRYGIFTARKI